MRPLLSSLVVFALGCMGNIEMRPPPAEVPAITVVSGAAVDTNRPARSVEGSFSAPSALWVQNAQATVLDGDTLSQRNGTTFATLTIGTSDDARTPGGVRALTTRGDGVFLAGPGGFFHDAPGHLLRSPLSDSFSMESVRFVDFIDNALYVTTATEAVRVLDGRREAVKVDDPDESGALQAVVGRSSSKALLVKGGSLYAVDLTARTVKTLARNVPTVTALSHRGDVVLLGTAEGLVEVAADDAVKRRTLAAASAAGQPVVDVEVDGDGSLVSTSTQVLHVTASGAVVLADVAQPWPDSVAKDSAGDVWFIDGTKVARLTTSIAPPPPSFATDVKPFLTAHCTSCHSSGANYAPVIDFTNYGAAKTYAQNSLRRLTDTLSPMPPISTETLTPAQYDVFVRWVDGGLLP